MKMEVVGYTVPMAEGGQCGFTFGCVLCLHFVLIAHFGYLPDETFSNGSPVFAGYFLVPIWKKMGSEDR